MANLNQHKRHKQQDEQKQRVIALITLVCLLVALVGLGIWLQQKRSSEARNDVKSPPTSTTTPAPAPVPVSPTPPTPAPAPKPEPELHEPIADFAARITKKKFGTYVTPQNSPVQPERFSGYHNAVDVEYQDVSGEVAVYAVADGVITSARRISGYGGVITLKATIAGASHLVLYGHVSPADFPAVGSSVKKGQKIGRLGIGYSAETDNERRHLHFAVRKDDSLDVRGYVQAQSQLSGWVDPLTLGF